MNSENMIEKGRSARIGCDGLLGSSFLPLTLMGVALLLLGAAMLKHHYHLYERMGRAEKAIQRLQR
ncbi:MAG: hypothetical protein KF715_21280 [Candidatus Didemnitutus sp.]|nr:hypothetical protein [Candidatus Didemnitutus sp.]